MANETLLTLAADIVTAHLSNNSVQADAIPAVIRSVYEALESLGKEPEIAPVVLEPAVSIRASTRPDALTCLDCGMKFKMLKRHLSTDHGLSPDEYRKRWNLPKDYPMVASDYANKRKELAIRIGLGRKPGQVVKKPTAKAGRTRKKVEAPTASPAPAETE